MGTISARREAMSRTDMFLIRMTQIWSRAPDISSNILMMPTMRSMLSDWSVMMSDML